MKLTLRGRHTSTAAVAPDKRAECVPDLKEKKFECRQGRSSMSLLPYQHQAITWQKDWAVQKEMFYRQVATTVVPFWCFFTLQ